MNLQEKRDQTHPQRVIIERNFMTLPVFAADQHVLDGYPGIRLEGQVKREGQYKAFQWGTTMTPRPDGTTPPYPGPQSRAAHMALISMMIEHPHPWPQVIRFEMDELRDRLRLTRGGRTYDQLRDSITSTWCLALHSQEAIYDYARKRAITAMCHVYDWVRFEGEVLPDGAGLTGIHGAIRDFDQWLELHNKNYVASRLWEFLHPCFYAGNPSYTIDYHRLVDHIPLSRRTFASEAKDQLRRPLNVLADFGMIAPFEWPETRGKADRLKMVLWRGDRMPTNNRVVVDSTPKEVPGPEQELVTMYYRLHYRREPFTPRVSDYGSAKQIIVKYGFDKAKQMLPTAIERMERRWGRKRADSFGGVVKYIHEVAQQQDRDERGFQEGVQQTIETRRHNKQVAQARAEKLSAWDEAGPELQNMVLEEVGPRPLALSTAIERLHERGTHFYLVGLYIRRLKEEQRWKEVYRKKLALLAQQGTPETYQDMDGEFILVEARVERRGNDHDFLIKLALLAQQGTPEMCTGQAG